MSRFSIEAVFRAVDKMSNPMRGMNRNTNKFARGLRTDFAKAQRQVDMFSSNLKKKLGRGLQTTLLGVGIAAAAGLGIAAKEFVEFENTVIAASAKFGPAFQQGTEGFEKLGAAARDIGATTEFSATQAAEGLDFLALAGFKAEQSMSLLPGVVDLATAAQTDLASASDIASDSLGAFGLMTEDTDQLAANFNRTMDVMAKTTTTSNTDLRMLAESVSAGAAAFTTAGQKMETFTAFTGVLSNGMVKGSAAGTSLRNVMLRLAKPTGEAADLLKSLGVETADSQGNFRDIIDILADFEKGLEGMGSQQKTAALATIFGAKTVTGINLLLGEGTDKLRAYRTQLEGSAGAAGDMAAVMRGSLANQIKTLQSAALEMGFKFIEAFRDQGAGGLAMLTAAITAFDPGPLIEVLSGMLNLVTGLVAVFLKFAPLILSVAGAFGTYRAVLLASALATKGLAAASAVYKAAQFIFIATTQGMTAAQAAFNGVAMANPIGLIVAAVGILIGLFAMLARRMGGVKEAFIAIGKTIMKFFLTPVNLMIEYIQLLLSLAAKLPGKAGAMFQGLDDKIGEFQGQLNSKLTGSEGAMDFGAAFAKPGEGSPEAPVTPAERAAVSREESTQKAELLIRDQSGRGELTMPQSNRSSAFAFQLENSGEF